MIDFKYCVWIIPKKNHIWYNCTNGFIPHITIKSKMNYNDALNLYNSITKENIEMNVKISSKSIYTVEKKFHALYFLVNNNVPNPVWWPENAHVSFRYRYNYNFTEEEIKNLESEISVLNAEVSEIKLVKCSGHFNQWIIIK